MIENCAYLVHTPQARHEDQGRTRSRRLKVCLNDRYRAETLGCKGLHAIALAISVNYFKFRTYLIDVLKKISNVLLEREAQFNGATRECTQPFLSAKV